MTSPFGDMDHLSVRVPAGMGSRLHEMAAMHNCSRAEFVRRVLCESIKYTPPPSRPVVAVPYVPGTVKTKPDPRAQTPIELFARGFTATQIATLLRKPYREIMLEIGQAVEDEARAGR